ncbi:MAG: GIY-YIG nuclease family protein [Acidobacteriota bacterium]
MRGIGKRFVYVLRSDSDPDRHYVGVTSDVDNRLEWHNHGPSGHTVEHRPWSLMVLIEFPIEEQALRFERYLKSGSGRAFAKRHFGHHLERPTDRPLVQRQPVKGRSEVEASVNGEVARGSTQGMPKVE